MSRFVKLSSLLVLILLLSACGFHLRQSVALPPSMQRIHLTVNNGGDLVEANIRAVNDRVPIVKIHASRGKYVRAEPVAALYEQSRVKHLGFHRKLEDQQCQWVPGESTWSPNRVDALVWAVTELDGLRKIGKPGSGSGKVHEHHSPMSL